MSKPKHAERAHAPLPPSASHRWGKCPPAMAYVDTLVSSKVMLPRIAGEAAERGTRIHEIAEPILRYTLEGKRAPKPEGDADEIAEAREYVAYVVERVAEANIYGKVQYGVEARATFKNRKECWGSCDFWMLNARRLTVIDLKSGFMYVDELDNTQLILYAMGICGMLESGPAPHVQLVDEIEICIWQPNGDREEPARSIVYTRHEFNLWSIKMYDRIDRAASYFGKPRAELEAAAVAGEHCTWCDALAICPKAKAYAMAISQKNFAPVKSDGKPGKMPEPKTLEPKQLAEILERAPMFVDWLDACKQRVIELMQAGHDVPGWKPVAKKTHRQWGREHKPAKIAKALGIDVDDLHETRMRSPSQVEKTLPAARKKRVNEFTFKPFEVTLAKTSDKRTALPSTKISFTPITREEIDNDG